LVCRFYNLSDDTCSAPGVVGDFDVYGKMVKNGTYTLQKIKKMSVIKEKRFACIFDVCPFNGRPVVEYNFEGDNKFCSQYKE